MEARPSFLRTTRWGLFATMACATVLAAGAGVSATPDNTGRSAASQSASAHGDSAATSGFSGGKWGDSSADAVAQDTYRQRRRNGPWLTVHSEQGHRGPRYMEETGRRGSARDRAGCRCGPA